MTLVEANELWIEEVPGDWKRSRIRNEAVLSPGYSSGPPSPREISAVVPMESVSTDGVIDFSTLIQFEDVAGGLTLFENGDVLFAKITPCMENGKGALVCRMPTRYGFGSTEFHVLRPSKTIDGRFLYYATFNPTFRDYAAENMTGAAGQKRVSSRFLRDTRLFLPPLPEQRRITAYLDATCAAIDAAVAAKRRQLETLDAVRESLIESAVTEGISCNTQMRAVNEDWITEIPSHWRVCRIKRVVSCVDYGISVSTEPEGRYPVLKMGHIQCGEIDFRDLDFVEEVSDDLLLETGDLLYNRTNSPDQVGKVAIFRRRKADEVTFASYLVRLRTNHLADPYYLNYLVNSRGFLSFARKLAIPSVQQSNLNSTRYCRMQIPLPPVTEQREIVAYLDAKIAGVAHLVAGIETQITTLTAYRKSLIHECVTGQRRISEADLKKVKAHG